MKSVFASALLAFLASPALLADTTTMLDETIPIEIKSPTQAFRCVKGDGGYRWTHVFLNTNLIPFKIAQNLRDQKISATVPHTTSCAQAMKSISDEIRSQGGRLQASARREVFRSATPLTNDGVGYCRLSLGERVEIRFGALRFFEINMFFIRNLSEGPRPIGYSECRTLKPAKI